MPPSPTIDAPPQHEAQRFPWRGAALGAVMCVLVVSASIAYNTRMARMGLSNDVLAACALFYLIVIVGVVNPILRLIARPLAFTSRELFVAFAMMIVASALPSWGLMQMWVSTITCWQYFATPENMWGQLFVPYLPQAAVVRDVEAIQYLYEGLPPDQSLPWSAWIIPAAFWFPFFIIFYLSCFSTMVLFRKQWVEHERLTFPMMQFPLELCKEPPPGRIAPPFFKDKMVWLGAALPFIILSYNGVAAFVPGLNPLTLKTYIHVLRRTVVYVIHLNFPALGFAYLVGVDISLSFWLFHVLARLETGVVNMLTSGLMRGSYVIYSGPPMAANEGFGAMAVLFLSGVWIARKRLAHIFRIGLRMETTKEDEHEYMSYRAAVWCVILGWFMVAVYLHATGFSWFQSAVFTVIAVVVLYSITRVVCEGGVGFARAVYLPSTFLANQFGTAGLGPTGVTALGFTFIWIGDIRTIAMTQAAQGMRLTESIERRHPMIWCLLIAVVAAIFGSLITALVIGYKYGLFNCQPSWPVWRAGTVHWNQVARLLRTPYETDPVTWAFMGVGATVMYLLIFLRQRLVWWPVHYIGYVTSTSWPMGQVWFSIFLAWLIKSVVLKFGAGQVYQRSRMFFLGMIFGALATSGVWTVIGVLTRCESMFTTGTMLW